MTSVSERIDEVRCMEILDYSTYDQPMVLFDIMGFGRPLDDIPMLLQPGIADLRLGQRRAPDRSGPRRRARRRRGALRTTAGAGAFRDRLRSDRGGYGGRAALRGARA